MFPNSQSFLGNETGDHFLAAGQYGQMTRQEVGDLYKALVAGSDIANPGTTAGGGFPFRVEFLDNMLRYLTYTEAHIKLFPALFKEQATNTVVEYNTVSDYGVDAGGSIAEGDLPEEHDMTIARNYATIKFLATMRRVTHPMQVIRSAHGDVIRKQAEAGTRWLLRAAEQMCFNGDSRVIPEQWDGIWSQGSQNGATIVDLRGARLSSEELNEGIGDVTKDPNYGMPTHLHHSVRSHTNLSKEFFPSERFSINGGAQTITPGHRFKQFQSSVIDSTMDLEPNVFIREGAAPITLGIGSAAKRPGVPAITVAATAGAAVATSQFGVADAATYIYRVVAVNRYGKSAPVDTATVAVAATENVTFTVQDAGGATGYEIYRSPVGGAGAAATALYITSTARTGLATVITDNNDDLPGTSKAYMLQQNPEAITFYQLVPMMMYPLAQIDLSVRWAQLLYGTLVLNAPAKHLIYRNVGDAAP